jgi:hypothetical protein
MTQAIEWVAYQGRLLYDPDSNAIGAIEEFYIDREDGKPVWALVYTGPDGTHLAFVPLREARIYGDGEDLQVSVTGDEVRDAPSIEDGGELSQDDERRLYQHYGMPYPEEIPRLTMRRQAVITTNRTQTSALASASRACSGDSFTVTATSRRRNFHDQPTHG